MGNCANWQISWWITIDCHFRQFRCNRFFNFNSQSSILGQRCEHQANACVSKPCGSHGVCSATKEGSFTCACKEGWTGPYCSVNINECANAPCKNGGKCIDREGDFLCECPPGWIGKTCQLGKHITLDFLVEKNIFQLRYFEGFPLCKGINYFSS